MRDEYDFSQARPNPYLPKKQVTIRLDQSTIDYFKNLSTQQGIPYQTLINSYLSDCARNKRELSMSWG
jgi:predicted DNA binding CopG/RHH family protein